MEPDPLGLQGHRPGAHDRRALWRSRNGARARADHAGRSADPARGGGRRAAHRTPGMSAAEYMVTWAMPIEVARDVEDAATRALAHLVRPGSLAVAFFVTGPDGKTHQVDLAGEIETH